VGKSLDQVQNERAMKAGKGAVVDSKDIELAVRMGIKLMTEGHGLDIIRQAVNSSKDPAQVIGQFLAQIMAEMGTKLQQEYAIDPKIFLAKGGWLEHMLDYIETQLGLPKDFSDQIFAQTVEVIKAAAQQPPAPNDVMGKDPREEIQPEELDVSQEGGGQAPPQAPPQQGGYDPSMVPQ
jgi:hypothetical protein